MGTCAPVAQLDRAFASGAKGRPFESARAYHFFQGNLRRMNRLPDPITISAASPSLA